MAIAIERSGVTTRRARRYRARRFIGHVLVYLGLTVALFFFLGPFFWIVTTSLKGNEDFFAYPPVWIRRRRHSVTTPGSSRARAERATSPTAW